jgi:hypothetical protein
MTSEAIDALLRRAFLNAGLTTAATLRDDEKVRLTTQMAYKLLPLPIRATIGVTLGKDSLEAYALKLRDTILTQGATQFSNEVSSNTPPVLGDTSGATSNIINGGTMQFKVVPFVAKISNSGGASDAASQLQTLISGEGADGWEYVRLEQIHTHVAGLPGDNGCFGWGKTQPTAGGETTYAVAVFRK